ANAAVGQSKIAQNAVGPSQIGRDAIVDANIDDGTIAAQKLVGTHVVKNSGLVSGFTSLDAQCPAGEVLLSGGVQVDSSGTRVIASGPDLSDNAPRSWFAQASSSGLGSMTVFAVCLK